MTHQFVSPSPRSADPRAGFTLIELLTAIAVFAVIVTIAVGGFANALRTQRQVTSLLVANSNAGFVLEEIAREMRAGRLFSCPVSCAGTPVVTFTNKDGVVVTYAYNGIAQAVTRREGAGPARRITSDSVAVTSLRFVVRNNASYPIDNAPTFVTIQFAVAPREGTIATNRIALQTSVSVRFDP